MARFASKFGGAANSEGRCEEHPAQGGSAWFTSLKQAVLMWWTLSTSKPYLESRMSRRPWWPVTLPALFAVDLATDVQTWLSTTDEYSWLGFATALTDVPVMVLVLWLSRRSCSSFLVDLTVGLWLCGTTIIIMIDQSVVGLTFWPISTLFIGQLLGLHGLVSICSCAVALFAWNHQSFQYDLHLLQYTYLLITSCLACLIIEFSISTSFHKLADEDAQKKRILDMATDGWGMLHPGTGEFTNVSSKLSETLGRTDLVGLPLKAVVSERDHDMVEKLFLKAEVDDDAANHSSDVPWHALLTFHCASPELQFDARVIVHEPCDDLNQEVGFSLTLVGEARTSYYASAASASVEVLEPDGWPESPPLHRGGAKTWDSTKTPLLQRRDSICSTVSSSSTTSRSACSSSISSKRYGAKKSKGRGGPPPLSLQQRPDLDSTQIRHHIKERMLAMRRQQAQRSTTAKQSASSRLLNFKPTPPGTRLQALQRLVRSCCVSPLSAEGNSGEKDSCCCSHCNWQAVMEIARHHVEHEVCADLQPQNSDWQCPFCLAVNVWPHQPDVPLADKLRQQLCCVCLNQVKPILGSEG